MTASPLRNNLSWFSLWRQVENMLASSPGQLGMSQCPGKAALHMIVKKSIILFVSVQCQCHCALLHLLVVRSARSSLLQSSLISKANFFIFMCLDILPVTNIAQDQVHSIIHYLCINVHCSPDVREAPLQHCQKHNGPMGWHHNSNYPYCWVAPPGSQISC